MEANVIDFILSTLMSLSAQYPDAAWLVTALSVVMTCLLYTSTSLSCRSTSTMSCGLSVGTIDVECLPSMTAMRSRLC